MKGLWWRGKEGRVGVKDERASRVNERWAGKNQTHIHKSYLLVLYKPATA